LYIQASSIKLYLPFLVHLKLSSWQEEDSRNHREDSGRDIGKAYRARKKKKKEKKDLEHKEEDFVLRRAVSNIWRERGN
jgi:hypothetical protein